MLQRWEFRFSIIVFFPPGIFSWRTVQSAAKRVGSDRDKITENELDTKPCLAHRPTQVVTYAAITFVLHTIECIPVRCSEFQESAVNTFDPLILSWTCLTFARITMFPIARVSHNAVVGRVQ